ncbi:MAG TPA: hypothetical protein VNO30_34380 [Kofleriaceae bacterium]|nr:hypothetical protein [Kofleriaceae bacterium]
MRVALIPTGRTEWHGLGSGLQRLFPGHDFYALPGAADFDSTGPFDGFTSTALTANHEGEYLPETASILVERAAQEALGDRRRHEADVVIVLDDLELANRHQPDRVIRVFRCAVERHVASLQGTRERTERALRERVSFHLIVPMIEAWLFGDPQALRVAGVPGGVVPLLDGGDLEDFHATDAQYLRASEADCPRWIARGRKKADRPKWLGDQRERHPKGYLQWLCRDGGAKSCTSYDESHGGAAALQGLTWDVLLAKPGLLYLGALVEDLADALGARLPLPWPPVWPDDPPATRLSWRPRNKVLRNL